MKKVKIKMRAHGRPISLFDFRLSTLLLATAGASAGELTYVDTSDGLESPILDGGSTELELGDLNGDGHPDLVCIGDHGSPFVNTNEHGIMVWFGDGAGQWSVFQNGNFGYGGVALGDVNNDGLLDAGYGMHHNYSGSDFGDQLLEVALGDGTGQGWTPWDDGLATNGETWGMFGTDFADIDNDGDLDIGSVSFGCCAGIHVYANNGDGTWVQTFGLLGGNASMEFFFGDFNGDGNADFAAAHGSGTVYLGDGTGGFAPADGNLPGGSWRRGISLGDANGDGLDDVVFRTESGVQVWSWVTDGVWQDLSGTLGVLGDFSLTQIVDMNLDGHGDVVAMRSGLVAIQGGDGAGNWAPIASIATPEACGTAALRAGTDADHNGYPDLAIVQEEDCDPFVGGTNRLRLYAESSKPFSAWIFPKSPRGGETFVAGSVRFIDWHAAVPGGGAPSVTIELSVSGPEGPWCHVTTVPSSGRHQWTVPAGRRTSLDCHLRLTLETKPPAVVVTPAPFTILGGPGPPGDLDGDGTVGIADLLILFAEWGPCDDCDNCPADLNGDCTVGVGDLLILFANWG